MMMMITAVISLAPCLTDKGGALQDQQRVHIIFKTLIIIIIFIVIILFSAHTTPRRPRTHARTHPPPPPGHTHTHTGAHTECKRQ